MDLSNIEIEEVIKNLPADLTSDYTITELLKSIAKSSVGFQNQALNNLTAKLINYGKIDLKKILKTLKNGAAIKPEPELSDERKYFKIADEILERFRIITLENSKQIMVFSSNSYSFNISYLESAISDKIREYNLPIGTVDQVLKYIQYSTYFDPERLNYDPKVMVFENGEFYFDHMVGHGEMGFCPAEEEQAGAYHYFYEIPHAYEPVNESGERFRCPKFKNALRMWLSAPFSKIRVRDIFEAIGLCMTMNMSFKTAFLNFGPPHSGKTQFFNIICHILGYENMCFSSLQRIGKDQFGAQGLQYTILDYCGDLPATKVNDNGMFKNITGGDVYVEGEIKNGPKFKFKPTNKFMANANKVPMFTDWDDDATYERMVLIPFPNQFLEYSDDTKKDYYKEIINDKNEIQGIIHEAIIGFRRLLKRGSFRAKLKENTKHLWNYNADKFYAFIYDSCDYDKHSKIQVDNFLDLFTDVHSGFKKNTITINLDRLGIKKKELDDKAATARLGKRKKSYYYVGIKWKESVLRAMAEREAEEEKEKKSIVDELFA